MYAFPKIFFRKQIRGVEPSQSLFEVKNTCPGVKIFFIQEEASIPPNIFKKQRTGLQTFKYFLGTKEGASKPSKYFFQAKNMWPSVKIILYEAQKRRQNLQIFFMKRKACVQTSKYFLWSKEQAPNLPNIFSEAKNTCPRV